MFENARVLGIYDGIGCEFALTEGWLTIGWDRISISLRWDSR